MKRQKKPIISRSVRVAAILLLLLIAAVFLPVFAAAAVGTGTGLTVSGGSAVPLAAASFPAAAEDETDAGSPGTGYDGTSDLIPAENMDRAWQYDVDTSTFKPDEYIVTASAVMEDATGTALFNLLERSFQGSSDPEPVRPSPRPGSSGYYITIDPIGDHYVGDLITITGRTNIPEGSEILVEVYSSSFKPTQKSQSGEFSGATGSVRASEQVPAISTSLSFDGGAGPKIIRTGTATLEVKDVTGTADELQALAAAQGGYLSSSAIQSSGSRRTGTVVIRVPQSRFDATLAGVKSAGTVMVLTTQGDDVTQEYVDLEAQKRSLTVQLAQYYELMKKATKISDIIAIQQQIDRVQTALDRLEGRLQYLTSRIDLSTITVTLMEPVPVQTRPGHSFASAVNRGLEGLFGFIDAMIITTITFTPVIILAGAGFILYRRRVVRNTATVPAGPDNRE